MFTSPGKRVGRVIATTTGVEASAGTDVHRAGENTTQTHSAFCAGCDTRTKGRIVASRGSRSAHRHTGVDPRCWVDVRVHHAWWEAEVCKRASVCYAISRRSGPGNHGTGLANIAGRVVRCYSCRLREK